MLMCMCEKHNGSSLSVTNPPISGSVAAGTTEAWPPLALPHVYVL